MKPTINKSQLMKRAWKIYRRENNTPRFGWGANRKFEFYHALRMAWRIEKREIERIELVSRQNAEPVRKDTYTYTEEFMQGCAEYYRNAPRGTYFGD